MSSRLSSTYTSLHRSFGYNKSYNFILFVIFAGSLLGFTLARFQFLSIADRFAKGASPGSWFWFRSGIYRVGITLHLATILPCGFFVIFQFVPIIRHRLLWIHRINGYTIIILLLLSNIGVFMIARRSFGGGLDTQAGVSLLSIITTVSVSMAYYNIRRLQIDEHRAWMLRTMFYMGSIVTIRLILGAGAAITSALSSYHSVWSCAQIAFTWKFNRQEGNYLNTYPMCEGSMANATYVPVKADLGAANVIQNGASLELSFGMAVWMAMFLHGVGVEIYLRLTPRESERLRMVSYERQLAAGYTNPGSAGLVVEKFGDANPWVPPKRGESDLNTMIIISVNIS